VGEVTRHCRKLITMSFRICPSPYTINDQITRRRWVGGVMRIVEKRNAYTVLVRKPEGRDHLEKLRRRWKDHIKKTLKKYV
jgi:hypothetical protein